MLEYACIFTKGGALLWTWSLVSGSGLRGNPVDALIRTCLLEDRSGESSFTYTPPSGSPYSLKWTMHNGLELVFVAVYQKALKLLYVDQLLERMKAEFVLQYHPKVYDYPPFSDSFEKARAELEAAADSPNKSRPSAGQAVQSRKGGNKAAAGGDQIGSKKGRDADSDSSIPVKAIAEGIVTPNTTTDIDSSGEDDIDTEKEGEVENGAFDVSTIKGKLGKRTGAGPKRGKKGASEANDKKKADPKKPKQKVSAVKQWRARKQRGPSQEASLLNSSTGINKKTPDHKQPKQMVAHKSGKDCRSKAVLGYPQKDNEEAAADRKWTSVARKWGEDNGGKTVLDYSQKDNEEAAGDKRLDFHEPMADLSLKSRVDEFEDNEEEDDSEEEEEEEAAGTGEQGGADGQVGSSFLSSWVHNIKTSVVGTAALTREDIEPALKDLKRRLMERNVAENIAEKVCESVATGLVGQKLAGFTRISSAVKTAVENALTRILTPKRSIDILRDIAAAKAKGRPYTIVFVGVNGVGKSTNLAKVAYWLLQNNISVMIAACDTFRSGAVEQLKTHCVRLGVPLYERGYEKDPAKVAFEGQRAAERNKKDVLLVDTAGRMQDNEPLMRALSNLIVINSPDLVLFVGEALVGNDAVDQLTKFNQRLADLAQDAATAHTIDGILLTKFDTIDDKVGAALSMVYTSGAPIMFVGCGQTYVDLKRLNTKSVVRSLLK